MDPLKKYVVVIRFDIACFVDVAMTNVISLEATIIVV